MITLNFREQNIFEMIKSGAKTVETRALNPDEPKRYFGNISVGDKIELRSVKTGEIIIKEVIRVSVYKSTDDYLDRENLSKIFGGPVSKNEALEKHLSFPGYEERLNKFGIVALEIR